MVNLKQYISEKVRDIISAWNEEEIYAISFFICPDECNEYRSYSNVPELFISYNTEKYCQYADRLSEERWNYAFWSQDVTPVIEAYDGDEGMAKLFEWYKDNGIENIGYEDCEDCYDSEYNYIGKGPIGCYELVCEVTEVAKELQTSGFIRGKFEKEIPIIIHDLEYCWYYMEATQKANPNGEADTFFQAMKELGIIE